MPTLTWIGKDKVVNHHHDVPYSVLEKIETFSTVNSQQSTVNSQQSTVNSQQSTVNSQQSTVNK